MKGAAASRLRRLALALGALAGGVLLLCVGLLIRDHAHALAMAAEDEPRLAALQEQARVDSEAAVRLNEEQRQQADVTLARRARRRLVVGVLIVSAVLFVLCAKTAQGLRGWRPPPLVRLAELRREADALAPPDSVLRGNDWPALELAEVDTIVAREGTSREAAIPILNALLARYGYLPDEALRRVCERSEITPAQIAGNATFYGNFRSSPVGRHVLRVCHGTACHVAGSRQLEDELRRHLAIPAGTDTDPARDFTVDRVACLGCCSLAPVMMVGEWAAGRLTPEAASQVVDALRGARA